jgi:hypothetical protein
VEFCHKRTHRPQKIFIPSAGCDCPKHILHELCVARGERAALINDYESKLCMQSLELVGNCEINGEMLFVLQVGMVHGFNY